MHDFLRDDRANAVLAKLHDLDRRQARRSLRLFNALRHLRGWLADDPIDWRSEAVRTFMRDKLVALDADKCRLSYMLCRAMEASLIVEVGTSFGVSTIYLAAAACENARRGSEGGKVIGTEIESSKVAVARTVLIEAGLADFVEILEGDVLETLKEIDRPVDFVLLDIWAPIALPALQLLMPRLSEGAVVLCDNVKRFGREYRPYLAHVRDPATGFVSTTLPMAGGLELSVRVTNPAR